MKKDDIKKNEEINENEDIKEARKLSDEELDQVSAGKVTFNVTDDARFADSKVVLWFAGTNSR